MRAVNLIPPEDRRGERAPLRSGPLAYVIVAALLLAFIGVYALVSTGNSISEREAQVETLEQQLAASEARAAALQSFSSFASLEQSRTQTIADLARSRFDWERVLRELALVLPEEVTLTALSGSVAGSAEGGSGGGEAASAGPSLSVSGCAAGHEVVASMLAAMRDIDGVTRVGLKSSTKNSEDAAAGGASTDAPVGGEAGAACSGSGQVIFELSVAFDEVVVDPAASADAPAPASDETGGVEEAQRDRKKGKDAVDSAGQKGRDAVDTLVPGA